MENGPDSSEFIKKEQLRKSSELQNIQQCQALIRRWVDTPEAKSVDQIPLLYTTLYGATELFKRKDSPLMLSDVIRNTDAWPLGGPTNLYPEHKYIRKLMYEYTDMLDEMLTFLPKSSAVSGNIEEINRRASLAYYVFARIHPFPDGNGRLGRLVYKRFIKATDMRDPVFHDERWYGRRRSSHLDAMNSTNNTGNPAHIELFFLNALKERYCTPRDGNICAEFDRVINKKSGEIRSSREKVPLSSIWEGFRDIPIYGNS